tara:strand:+ start:1250 stop:1420 length:171 start_codon:yes stop_codon:yes gene_type:complete
MGKIMGYTNEDKTLIIDSETKQELFEVLYTIEDIEHKTELGERVSKLLTKLELLNK